MNNREQIEKRIFEILEYIDKDKRIKSLFINIKLFSTKELFQLLNFLETWEYKSLYILLDKKIEEYLNIIKRIKQIKIWKKVTSFKEVELEERKKESVFLENILSF